jgi:hypothetical protein
MNRRTFVLGCHLFALILISCTFASATFAQDRATVGPADNDPHSERRTGGVLAQSYGYHRQDSMAPTTVAPAGGWYGYGFPVKTHRWGWFGAAHYYPTVLWHHGYMGDHKRWAYRKGY